MILEPISTHRSVGSRVMDIPAAVAKLEEKPPAVIVRNIKVLERAEPRKQVLGKRRNTHGAASTHLTTPFAVEDDQQF